MNKPFNANQYLIDAGVSPTLPRLVVLNDLYHYRTHASADEILQRIQYDYPNMTQRTVYNTLNLFVERGLIAQLTIDEHCVHYDFCTDFHAHFRCEQCGCIHDIMMPQPMMPLPHGAVVRSAQYFVFGVCKECSMKKKN